MDHPVAPRIHRRAPDPTRVSRRRLTRGQIVAAATRLLDRDGLERFSIRRLARELDVGAMTLYGYFGSRDELLDAVVEHHAASLDLPDREGSWREQVAALMSALREGLIEHPSVVELRLRRPLITPAAMKVAEAALQALGKGGLEGKRAALAYRSLLTFTFGSVAFTAGDEQIDSDREPDLALLREASDDATFRFGLERILDGIANL